MLLSLVLCLSVSSTLPSIQANSNDLSARINVLENSLKEVDDYSFKSLDVYWELYNLEYEIKNYPLAGQYLSDYVEKTKMFLNELNEFAKKNNLNEEGKIIAFKLYDQLVLSQLLLECLRLKVDNTFGKKLYKAVLVVDDADQEFVAKTANICDGQIIKTIKSKINKNIIMVGYSCKDGSKDYIMFELLKN